MLEFNFQMQLLSNHVKQKNPPHHAVDLVFREISIFIVSVSSELPFPPPKQSKLPFSAKLNQTL